MIGAADRFLKLFPEEWRPVVTLAVIALAATAYYIALQSLKPKKKRRNDNL